MTFRSKDRDGRDPEGMEQGIAVLESKEDASVATLSSPELLPRGPRTDASPWVIVLAGGEGRRLQAFTTLRNGVAVPKQFCHFRDDRTLLGATIDRAMRIAPREHVIVVVVEGHRDWWEPEVARLSADHVLSQPANRGTAVAILHALVHIHLSDPTPRVIVMPSDHDFEDETAIIQCVTRATRTAELFPSEIVLLGIAPSHLDADYGLIVPGTGMQYASRPVRAFVEKPTLTAAAQLTRAGALWNSFIFASTGSALYDAFEAAVPSLVRTYLQGLATVRGDPQAMTAMFEELPEYDFSRDVLQRNAVRLRLIEVPSCGWTDLGMPARLAAWLERHREAPFWREEKILYLHGPNGPSGAEPRSTRAPGSAPAAPS
jgi:mannose-1-phosphate guanylyltransferase